LAFVLRLAFPLFFCAAIAFADDDLGVAFFTRTQNQSGNSQQQRYNNAMMIVLMVHTKE
jgi:hypothetical protein